MTIDLIDDRTPPLPVRVPKSRPASYYMGVHSLHRVQAARAQRVHRGHRPWTNGLRIFLYHRVSTDDDDLAIAPDVFRAQMESILRSGVKPVGLDEAVVRLEEGAPGAYVCVTFDDGYHDNLDHAIPVLRELRIPATFFVVSGITDGAARLYWYDAPPPTLSWSEVQAIDQEDLFTVGAHSRTHPALQKLTDEAAWGEIAGSRRDLEERLGRPVTSFAYPAGLQGEREIRLAREAGYRVALTCNPGVNGPQDRPHALHRTHTDRRDNLKMFEARLTGLLDEPWGRQTARDLATRLRLKVKERLRSS